MTKLPTRIDNFFELPQTYAAVIAAAFGLISFVGISSFNPSLGIASYLVLAPLLGVFSVGVYEGEKALNLIAAGAGAAIVNFVLNTVAALLFGSYGSSGLGMYLFNLVAIMIMFFSVWKGYDLFVKKIGGEK